GQRRDDRRRGHRAPARRRARGPGPERGSRSCAGLYMNFEAVLAGLPDAVIAVDVDARVVFWNEAAEELVARSARRAVGRGLKDIFPFDDLLIRRLQVSLMTELCRVESETAVITTDIT